MFNKLSSIIIFTLILSLVFFQQEVVFTSQSDQGVNSEFNGLGLSNTEPTIPVVAKNESGVSLSSEVLVDCLGQINLNIAIHCGEIFVTSASSYETRTVSVESYSKTLTVVVKHQEKAKAKASNHFRPNLGNRIDFAIITSNYFQGQLNQYRLRISNNNLKELNDQNLIINSNQQRIVYRC